MSALIPPEQAGDHAPYALSAPGNLEAALRDAGLQATGSGEVVCHWRYADMDEAVRALLCSAGGARAAEAAGEQAVRDVLPKSARPVPGPANRRRQPAQHLPVGGRPPVTRGAGGGARADRSAGVQRPAGRPGWPMSATTIQTFRLREPLDGS